MKRRKPWRLYVRFADGTSKTIAYGSETAARRAARFEESLGAVRTRIWREDPLDYV